MASGGWGRENGELAFNGCGVLVAEDKRILGADSGDGRTTVWMYQMPLNCHWYMLKIVSFKIMYICNICVFKKFLEKEGIADGGLFVQILEG